MRVAICPGSFDPITLGHLDIITRACKLFDKVIVLVSDNPDKNATFTVEQKLDFIDRATAHLPEVESDYTSGLLADYMRDKNACAIVKGLRAISDFEYEFQMALANRKLNPDAETVFLTTQGENMYLSSSLVRQIAGLGGDISGFVPEVIQKDIEQALKK